MNNDKIAILVDSGSDVPKEMVEKYNMYVAPLTINYEDKQYVHSLQWTIGLELMLLIEDPWRVFLTTDHPNGGPFTSYPHLLRLLMDRSFRLSMLESIHPRAAENSVLRELTREYTLDEVAIITRAAPARILGLHDRGTLSPGAIADVAVYAQRDNWEATFERASLVMKGGAEVVHDGEQLVTKAECQTLFAEPQYDDGLMEGLAETVEQRLHVPWRSLEISLQEIQDVMRTGSTVSSSASSSKASSSQASSLRAAAGRQVDAQRTEGAS